jgi:hypothetical protein
MYTYTLFSDQDYTVQLNIVIFVYCSQPDPELHTLASLPFLKTNENELFTKNLKIKKVIRK